jgi:hypothetical protein
MARSNAAAKVVPIKPKVMRNAKPKQTKIAKSLTKVPAVPTKNPKQAKRPQWQHIELTVRDILEMIANKKLKIDPIGNRPSTVDSESNAKNRGIINSVYVGIGVSQIVLRDIADEQDLKNLYGSGVEYVVIDGGHRSRAFKWYVHETRFGININGKIHKWTDLTPTQQKVFMDCPIPVSIVKCDADQAMEIFLDYNKTTVVKPYSIIMSNEQSEICKFVRQQTRTWDEYGTFCHPLFRLENDEPRFHYGTVPNKHNIWDTYVFIAIHKIRGKGNVAAGEKQTKELVNTVVALTEYEKAEVRKFLDALMEVYNYNQKLITLEYFGCFQAVYFAEYADAKGKLKIGDMRLFTQKFHAAYGKLLSKKNLVKHTTEKGDIIDQSKFLDDACIEFTHPDQQNLVAEIFRDEMYK